MLEDPHDVFSDVGLVVVRVAGREQGDPAAGLLRCDGLVARWRPGPQPVSEGPRGIRRYPRVAVHAERRLERRPRRLRCVRGVDERRNDRLRREASDRIRRAQHPVAKPGSLPAVPHRLGPQHQVRKVHVPLVRRDVRTLRHEAHVAQVAVIDDLPVVRLRDPVHLHGRGLVDQIEQGGESMAEVEAAAAAVADVVHPLQLREQGVFVLELRALPVERMTLGRPEAALLAIGVVRGHVAGDRSRRRPCSSSAGALESSRDRHRRNRVERCAKRSCETRPCSPACLVGPRRSLIGCLATRSVRPHRSMRPDTPWAGARERASVPVDGAHVFPGHRPPPIRPLQKKGRLPVLRRAGFRS